MLYRLTCIIYKETVDFSHSNWELLTVLYSLEIHVLYSVLVVLVFLIDNESHFNEKNATCMRVCKLME